MVIEVAAKKKSTARSSPDERRAFTVVLEDLHAKFDVFGEALQGVRSDVAALKSLHPEVAALRHDVAALKSLHPEVAALRHDVAALQSLHPEVAALRDGVREMREEVAEVRNDVGFLRRDVALLKVAVLDNVREIKQLRKAR